MEKFSTWRDKATGISPFMPIQPPQQPWYQKLAKMIVFIVRLPLFLATILIYGILPLKAIARFVLLTLFGLKNLQIIVDGVKRSNSMGILLNLPKEGDIIFCNYISPLDGYIFQMISKAKFIILVPDENGKLYKLTPWSLFNFTFKPRFNSKPIDNLQQYKDRAIFILLEGTTTNNKGLLPFINIESYKFDGFVIKSMIVKINPSYYTLPIPYISKWRYFYLLLSNFNVVNHYIKAKIYLYQKFDIKQIRNSFEINQINPVSLSIEDKTKFITYYQNFKVKKD